jgi:hypothetical protein
MSSPDLEPGSMVEFVPPPSSGVGVVQVGVPLVRSSTRVLLLRAREENSPAV